MSVARGEVMYLAELKQKSIADLNDVARELKIEGAAGFPNGRPLSHHLSESAFFTASARLAAV